MRPCDKIIENMLVIANKEAVTVDFRLNKVQLKYSASATNKDIILKARREGFSSYIRGEFLAACLTQVNTRAVILSQDTTATQKHLEVVKFHIKHMKGATPQIGYNSKLEISFPLMDSTYYIGTAGSHDFGRGDTITYLHMSEAAFYEDLKTLQASVMQAAAHAKRIILESTANGFNHFYTLCAKAQRGEGGYTLHFYPWFFDEDNWLPLMNNEKLTLWDDDILLQKRYELTDEQMKWYVVKRADFMDSDSDADGLNLFHQEYPSTIEEAFISSGATFFRTIPYEDMPAETEGHTLYFLQPIPGHKYVIGVDYSGGVGQDFGVIQVVDASTFEQVCIYRDSWTDAEMLSLKAASLGRKYNMAFIVPEANNHGALGINILKKGYPVSKIYTRETPEARKLSGQRNKNMLGFLTTEKSKDFACGSLRVYLKRGLKIHDKTTWHELQVYEEVGGKLGAPEGDYDDTVMSLSLAAVGIKQLIKPEDLPIKAAVKAPPVSGPIYPWSNAEDLLEIVQNTPKGRSMIYNFYSRKDADALLRMMERTNG